MTKLTAKQDAALTPDGVKAKDIELAFQDAGVITKSDILQMREGDIRPVYNHILKDEIWLAWGGNSEDGSFEAVVRLAEDELNWLLKQELAYVNEVGTDPDQKYSFIGMAYPYWGRVGHAWQVMQKLENYRQRRDAAPTNDPESVEFFKDVSGVVEASRYEQHQLYDYWKHQHGMDWVSHNPGFGIVVGDIAERPVFVSFNKALVNGRWILFYEVTSQARDSVLVEDWLKRHLPEKALRDGGEYIKSTDPTNFHIATNF